MKFSTADIHRLYGQRLFLLPSLQEVPSSEAPEEAVAEPKAEEKLQVSEPQAVEPNPDLSVLTSGSAVTWRMKPQARVVMIIREEEFPQKELTGLLKAQLVEAGIDPQWVGFGVIPQGATAIDLQEMALSAALVCEDFGKNWPAPVQLAEKRIWVVPGLQQMAGNPQRTAALRQAMTEIREFLS
ncbi:MAG: hypothetical protein AAFR61_18970 [Bacteroidota bacterium]